MSYTNTESDANFNIYNGADTSSKLKFDLANIASSTTRTLTMPDRNVYMSFLPSQGVNTASTPQFAKIGIAQAAGTEVIEVNGTAKVSTAGGLTIGASTPSAAQWGYLAATNQDLATTSPATFTTIKNSGQLRLKNGAFNASIQAPAAATAPYTLTLPAADGADTQVIATNGSGTLSWVDNLGGNTSFSDAVFNIYDGADTTAKAVFDASAISPATTRTISVPNNDVDLSYMPNQLLGTAATPQFTKLGIAQAAGTETLEVTGTASISTAGGLTVGASTPSTTQLGYLGALDQSVGTSSNATFAGLNLGAGSASLPALYFGGETTTGLYEVTPNDIGIAASGAKIAEVTANLTMNAPLLLGDGTSAAPSLAFSSDTNTGMYRDTDGAIAFSAGGTKKVGISATTSTINGAQVTDGNWATKFYSDAEYALHRTVNWEQADMGTTSNVWTGLACGGGYIVAVSSNLIAYSTNGVTYVTASVPTVNNWTSVVQCGEMFIAVSSTGTGTRVMRSYVSGMSFWFIEEFSMPDNDWQSIATDGVATLVAVANTGVGDRVMLSDASSGGTGYSWTSQASAANNDWSSVAYGGGVFCAVATSGSGDRVMTSGDLGVTWVTRASAANNAWQCVCYGGGVFVAVASSGSGDRIMTSGDLGVTWVTRACPFDLDFVSVCYGGLDLPSGTGVFMAISNSTPSVIYSVDAGATWYAADMQSCPLAALNRIAYCSTNDVFAMVTNASGAQQCFYNHPDKGDPLERAINTALSNWTYVSSSINGVSTSSIRFIYSPYAHTYYGFDDTAAVNYSCDGIYFAYTATSTSYRATCCSPDLGLLCVGGASGQIATAVLPSYGDPGSWTARSSPLSTLINKIDWIGDLGYFNILTTDKSAYSSDGSSWTSVTFSTSSKDWKDFAWSSKLAIGVAVADGLIAYSTTLTSWTTQAQTGTFTSIAYSPELNLFLAPACGTSNCIVSSNGTSWSTVKTNVTFSNNSYNCNIIWISQWGVFFHAGNNTNKIAFSRDGKYWISVAPVPSCYPIRPCFSADHGKVIFVSSSNIYYSDGFIKTITV